MFMVAKYKGQRQKDTEKEREKGERESVVKSQEGKEDLGWAVLPLAVHGQLPWLDLVDYFQGLVWGWEQGWV